MAAIFLTRNSWKLNFRGCKDRDGFSRRNRPRDRRNEEIRPIVDDEVTMTGWRGGYSWILNVILNKFNPGFHGEWIFIAAIDERRVSFMRSTSFLLVRSNNRLSRIVFLFHSMLLLLQRTVLFYIRVPRTLFIKIFHVLNFIRDSIYHWYYFL